MRDTAQKRKKMADLLDRMHPRDRAKFEESQKKYKANVDHDLWTASMFVLLREG